LVQEAPPLFPVLWGLWMYDEVRPDLGKSPELAERLFTQAQRAQDPAKLLKARLALAVTSLSLGDPAATREHTEQGDSLYDPRRHCSHTHLFYESRLLVKWSAAMVERFFAGGPILLSERRPEA
jgi:hypothetical protein